MLYFKAVRLGKDLHWPHDRASAGPGQSIALTQSGPLRAFQPLPFRFGTNAGGSVAIGGRTGSSAGCVESDVYRRFRQQLSRAILLGLEPLWPATSSVPSPPRRLAASDRRGGAGRDRAHPHVPELLARGGDNRAMAMAAAGHRPRPRSTTAPVVWGEADGWWGRRLRLSVVAGSALGQVRGRGVGRGSVGGWPAGGRSHGRADSL